MPIEVGRAVDMPLGAYAAARAPTSGGVASGLLTALRREARDARIWQIAALSMLLVWNITQLSLGASLVPSLLAICSALAVQAIFAALLGAGKTDHRKTDLRKTDLRSPLITGLSLSLLLRGDAAWVMPAAAGVAIASKFLLRWNGKHLFNPAAIAILVMLATGHGWVSPGQWGQSTLIVVAIVFLAILVLTRAGRLDTALTFLASHAALLFARAFWLGDPPAIPLHQLQNGALLLFAFFMITDPRTTPDARAGRVLFAIGVATLAHWLAFDQQVRPALYVALIAASAAVPLLDRLFPVPRFVWRPCEETST